MLEAPICGIILQKKKLVNWWQGFQNSLNVAAVMLLAELWFRWEWPSLPRKQQDWSVWQFESDALKVSVSTLFNPYWKINIQPQQVTLFLKLGFSMNCLIG